MGPIHDLICELCSDLLDSETLERLGFNDGKGPHDSALCNQMAERFAAWLKDHPEGHQIDLGMYVTPDGHLVDGRKGNAASLESAHSIDADALNEWIDFLRHCGGFEVW